MAENCGRTRNIIESGRAHGALLTTFPGDITMATLEQVKALAADGSAGIEQYKEY